jgi:cytochrome b561
VTSSDREAVANRLHFAVAAGCGWLIATSPWVGMLRRVPADPGLLDVAHVVVGFATSALALVYAAMVTRGSRWRALFPLGPQGLGAVARDVRGLAQRRIPSAESGGIYALVEGLLLVALLAAVVTGVGWFLSQGGPDALSWRTGHIVSARVLIGLAVAHVLAVASHLLEL